MEFLVIENFCGNFMFSTIKAKNIEKAYEIVDDNCSPNTFPYVVPLEEIKKAISQGVKDE